MTDDGAGGSVLKVTFENSKIFNANQSEVESRSTNNISLSACIGASGIEPEYDYTQLGETWSTPRIVRIPKSSTSKIESDRYVAVLGAGMAKNDACAGSAVFLVDLEGHDEGKGPGSIYGAETNGGPIIIVDTSPSGVTAGDEILSTPSGK